MHVRLRLSIFLDSTQSFSCAPHPPTRGPNARKYSYHQQPSSSSVQFEERTFRRGTKLPDNSRPSRMMNLHRLPSIGFDVFPTSCCCSCIRRSFLVMNRPLGIHQSLQRRVSLNFLCTFHDCPVGYLRCCCCWILRSCDLPVSCDLAEL